MPIRTKTTLFIVLTVATLVGLIALIHARTSLERFRQIEDEQVQADVDRVVLQVATARQDIEGTSFDWAYWDDTYEFVQDGNEGYVDDNLYVEAFAPLGVELVAFIDNDGRVLYDNWFRGDDEIPVPDELLELAMPGGALAGFDEVLDVNAGIVVVDGAPLIVASRGTTTSNFEGPHTGIMIMAREMSDDFVEGVSALTDLDVAIAACQPGSCTMPHDAVVIDKTSDDIFGSTVINGFDGAPAVSVDIAEPREIYSEGVAGIKRVLLITLAVGFAAAAGSVILARVVFVGRLEALNETVTSVGERRDHSTRVSVEGRDEIGSLATGINEMLDGLEESQTELVAAKNQIELGSEAKSRFLSRVSHEVRNPLNGVIAYAQLLQMDDLDEEQSDSVKQILTAGRHITSLLEEFLDIARIEAGAIPLDSHPIDLTESVNDAMALSRPSADERSIALRQSGDAGVLAIADEVRLRQVLLNLLSNAIKYGTEGGFVAVHHETTGDRKILTVTDNGPGISEENLERLFVPFDRLDADSSSVSGTGVGLAVTKQLIELMDGSIRVESQLGTGTCFTVELPAARVDPSTGTVPSAEGATMHTTA